MPAKKLKDFLDRHHTKYVSVQHSPAYTAQEIAACAHVSGKEMAKTVVVELDGTKALAVVPANQKVILQDLREITGCERVRLVAEPEFRELFPDCEIGAMPPFGNLYDMETYLAPQFADHEEIAFNAGTHTELIRMAYSDFAALVRPKIFSFTT